MTDLPSLFSVESARFPVFSSFARRGLVIVVTLTVGSSGCGKPATDGPPPEIDLTRATDIFKVPSTPRSPTSVVFTVNGVPVRESELSKERRYFLGSLPQSTSPENLQAMAKTIEQQVVDQATVKHLLLEAAEASGVEVDPGVVETGFRTILSRIEPGMDPETFFELNQTSESALREDIRKDAKVKLLLEQVAKTAPQPTDHDVRAFYEANESLFIGVDLVEARHLFLRLPPGATEKQWTEREAEAEALKTALEQGGDFAALASLHSEDASARNGGVIGPYLLGQAPPGLESALAEQAVGVVGPPLRSADGIHLLEITARPGPKNFTVEEAHERIVNLLNRSRQAQAVDTYVKKLRGSAVIEFMDGP